MSRQIIRKSRDKELGGQSELLIQRPDKVEARGMKVPLKVKKKYK